MSNDIAPAAPATPAALRPVVLPAGTEIAVRLGKSLSSGTAAVKDRFDGTTAEETRADNRVAVAIGAHVRGMVTAVDRSRRSMTVQFDQLSIADLSYQLQATGSFSASDGKPLTLAAGSIIRVKLISPLQLRTR